MSAGQDLKLISHASKPAKKFTSYVCIGFSSGTLPSYYWVSAYYYISLSALHFCYYLTVNSSLRSTFSLPLANMKPSTPVKNDGNNVMHQSTLPWEKKPLEV